MTTITASQWQPLQQGDKIALVAPGRGMSERQLEDASAFISSLGYVPDLPADLLGDDLFSSNSLDYRFSHLKRVLQDDSIKAIWCLKGGYGSGQLVPLLEKLPQPKQPKLFIGFSDITALHLFFAQNWGWKTLHAPVLWQIVTKRVDVESTEMLQQVISGKVKKIDYAVSAMNSAAQEDQQCTSVITGGNLALVQTSLATSWQIDTRDKIVLLEDLDERPYAYDRMLLQLTQSGVFAQARAVIIGDFLTGSGEEAALEACLQRFANSLTIPALRLPGIGHASRNLPLSLNSPASLTCGKRPSLSVSVI